MIVDRRRQIKSSLQETRNQEIYHPQYEGKNFRQPWSAKKAAMPHYGKCSFPARFCRRVSDATLLREMTGFAAGRVMTLDTHTLRGPAPGMVGLRIPKLRRGKNFAGFCEPRRMAKKEAIKPGTQEARNE
jgi:hypothetical protein